MLPSDHAKRKGFPLLTYLTAYCPDAIEALVELSIQGNVQHNVSPDAVNPFKLPGDKIIWDRSKSQDQCETIMRHLWDHMRALRGVGSIRDSDGILHITKAMWRCGAEGQLTIEGERASDPPVSLTPSFPGQLPVVDRIVGKHPALAAGYGPDINGAAPSDPVPTLIENAPASGPRGYIRPDGPRYVAPAVGLHTDIPAGLPGEDPRAFDPAG